jgi:hypothetical protein
VNGANGMSDIEGKVTRVGVSALGSERVSNGDGYRRSRRLIFRVTPARLLSD